ncbi:hypothetical protein MKW98_017136 [Papaver atlanticum]|uniref:Uncharacterized protein n=1 Tax=Papaver atlanticum TaxID=357466 RepID=A0AAD4XZH8_9MAGN|nr:hypothetical protein MKW98_017136 [Papaver atlanticum]
MVDVCSPFRQVDLSAELLRARFSDTIFKAEVTHELMDEKNQSVRLQKEKKLMENMRLPRLQKEKKLMERMPRRALEELEKNVVVDDWHNTYKNFLMLINSK